MTHAEHAWAPTGTPGRCLEGVTPGLAGIFSALSYFVAETPIIFHMFYELIKGPLKQVVKSFGNDQKVRLIFLPFI